MNVGRVKKGQEGSKMYVGRVKGRVKNERGKGQERTWKGQGKNVERSRKERGRVKE